jgi:inward rectifier potassium channel
MHWPRFGAIGGPNAATFGSLLWSPFLSVQTLATVGYGHLAPASLTANIIATIEMFFGLLMVAIMTGQYVRAFLASAGENCLSDHAVVAPYHDGKAYVHFANTQISSGLG